MRLPPRHGAQSCHFRPMASPTKNPPPPTDEFYVLKLGDIVGPFTEAELRAAVAEGRLTGKDFAQSAGLPIWRPLARLLALPDEQGLGAVAPDLRSLMRWTWLRLRYHLDEDSVDAGVLCLLGGIVALGLARWPAVFWLPWFVAAAVAGVALLRRQRRVTGVLLLGAVVAVPVLFAMLGSGRKTPTMASSASAAETRMSLPLPTPAPFAFAPAPVPVSPSETKALAVVEPSPARMLAAEPVSFRRENHLAAQDENAGALPDRIGPAKPVAAVEVVSPSAPAPPAPAIHAAPPATVTLPNAAAAPVVTASTLLPKPPAPTAASPISPPLIATPVTRVPEPGMAQHAANTLSELEKRNAIPPIPSPAPPPASAPETPAKIEDFIYLVETDSGQGSAFLLETNGATYLVTNYHVLAGARRAKLQNLSESFQLEPGTKVEVASNQDLVRISMPGRKGLPLDSQPEIDASVTVFGNPGGGMVVTREVGKILGVGPDVVEVSAQFIQGNSGGPIVNANGQVVGIATFLKRHTDMAKWVTSGTRFESARRFGVRLTNSIRWSATTWSALSTDSTINVAVETFLNDAATLANALAVAPYRERFTPQVKWPAFAERSKVRTAYQGLADAYNSACNDRAANLSKLVTEEELRRMNRRAESRIRSQLSNLGRCLQDGALELPRMLYTPSCERTRNDYLDRLKEMKEFGAFLEKASRDEATKNMFGFGTTNNVFGFGWSE
jgi:S1-C subfamily serine protease